MLPKHDRLAGAMARLAAALVPALVMAVLGAGGAAPLAAQNLLTNPDFDTGIDGWQVIGPGSWDPTLDAGGSPHSGSAKGVFNSQTSGGVDGVITQCVPLAVGTTYHLGGKVFIPPGNTATGSAGFLLIPFPTADCSGPPPPGPIVSTPPVSGVGSWTDSLTTFVNSFAKSGELWTTISPVSGGRYQANYDDVVVATGVETCTTDPHTLCLLGGRFTIAVGFDPGTGNPSNAQAVPVGNSGYFWFFNPDNVEAFVKMIDACALNNHFWFFAAGLTNLRTVIAVTDTQTGAIQVYTNPANTAFQPIQDTRAFACP